MEPRKTHGAALPQQSLTRSAGGCPSEPRSEDLMLGGHAGANLHAGQRVANEELDLQHATTSQFTKTITRLDAFKMFTNKTKKLPPDDRVNIIFSHFDENYNVSMTKEEFKPTLSTFLYKSNAMYEKCKRNMKYFAKKHGVWLSKPLLTGQLKEPTDSTSKSKDQSKSPLLKSRLNLESPPPCGQEEPLEKKIEAFVASLQVESSSPCGQEEALEEKIKTFVATLPKAKQFTPEVVKDMAEVIIFCLKTPDGASKVIEQIKNQSQKYDKTLALIMELGFTPEQYINLREVTQELGHQIYPPYRKLKDSRNRCYPPNAKLSEREASVTLQDLLQHTFERILKVNDEVVTQLCDQKSLKELECTLKGNWECGVSTRLRFAGQGGENVVSTSFTPLELKSAMDILWSNPDPKFYRYCRPLCVQFGKDIETLLKTEKNKFETQLKNLEPLVGETSKGHKIKAYTELHYEAINSEILTELLDNCSQMKAAKLFHRALESSDPLIATLGFAISQRAEDAEDEDDEEE